ncbi:aminoacylase-1-like [Polistes fuscatus]|uniref:aminoacylase-1-like n=1 Tax=Polistes fuscatus TaxID=30207 RepID=UPI001CA8DBD6|nr:aminoacylase-1-like [Polistes fuscatus]
MDVVPVFEDKWTYLSFNAHMDEHGNIYLCSSQNMTCVGIQYLEAVRRMKMSNQRFERTIHISFLPDEEIGGKLGIKEFVHSNNFKAINIGFALDEGIVTSRIVTFYILNGERSIWHIEVHYTGNPYC